MNIMIKGATLFITLFYCLTSFSMENSFPQALSLISALQDGKKETIEKILTAYPQLVEGINYPGGGSAPMAPLKWLWIYAHHKKQLKYVLSECLLENGATIDQIEDLLSEAVEEAFTDNDVSDIKWLLQHGALDRRKAALLEAVEYRKGAFELQHQQLLDTIINLLTPRPLKVRQIPYIQAIRNLRST